MRLDRLYPEPASVSVPELLGRLDVEVAPPGRPYVGLNMVATLDGRAALAGRTGKLGSEADHAVFHGLRELADAVLVGAGTARIERYGRMVRDPERRERRRAAGLAPDPLAVVVSASGRFPDDLPLLNDPDQRVLVTGDPPAEMLASLHAEYGVRTVLCEGGPTLNAHLLAADLVDELFLTTAPMLLGGENPLTIVAGRELPRTAELDLVTLAVGHGDLFGRWRVRR